MTTGKQPRIALHDSGAVTIETNGVRMTVDETGISTSMVHEPSKTAVAGVPPATASRAHEIVSAFAGKSPGTIKHPEQSSPVRVFHREANRADADPRAPRMVDCDEFMAIQPSALERAFFGGLFDFDEDDPYEMIGSVAVLSIDGPLMQRGNWRYDGYESIRTRFEQALADRAVTAIVLKINSPGGVCAGCFSAVRAMQSAKVAARKPVIAYADETAYSAAYAMACIADNIYLPPEGGVGSIGVIGVLEDWSKFNEMNGLRVVVVTSGARKADGHEDVPLTGAVIDRYQARIDMLGRAFAEVVANARGLTVQAVLDLEAACLYGTEAVNAGLANGIATFDETVALAQQLGVASTTRTIIYRNV